MKKILKTVLAVVVIAAALFTVASAEYAVTLYAPDGRTTSVYESQVDTYISLGWYLKPVITMYSESGRQIVVYKSEVEKYKKVGWSDNLSDFYTTLYSKNGTISVKNYEVDAYLAVGWHRTMDELYTTIYSQHGSVKVFNDEVDAYLAVGWSRTPVKLDSITQLPVEFTKTSSYGTKYSVTLESFTFEDAYYYGGDEIEIYYDAWWYGDVDNVKLQMNCFDGNGVYLGSADMGDRADTWVSVNKNTAFFTITCKDYNGYTESGEYKHVRQIDLYSLDGRMITVFDVQTPMYTDVGWMEIVTLYSLDGRTIEVPPYMAESYKQVGWYTEAGYYYYQMVNEADFYIASYNYRGAMDIVDSYMDYFYGTDYYYPAVQKKEQAMDKWRNSVKSPLVQQSYYISNTSGTPKATITFRNLSYKTVIAFKVSFTCHDVFGDEYKTNSSIYVCDDAYIFSGGTATYTCTLNGIYNKNIKTLKNFKITEVVFSDGTKV